MNQQYFLLCQKHFYTIRINLQQFPTFLNFSKKNFVSHVFQVTIILFPLMTTCPKFRSIVTLQVKFEQMLALFVAKDVSQDNVPSGCINRLMLPCREKLYHFSAVTCLFLFLLLYREANINVWLLEEKLLFSLSVVCKYTAPNRSWRERHRRFKTYFV